MPPAQALPPRTRPTQILSHGHLRHRRADPRGRPGRADPGQPARRLRHRDHRRRRRREADRLPARRRPGRRVAAHVPDRRRRRAGAAAHHAATTSCGWSTARARYWPTSRPAPRTTAGRRRNGFIQPLVDAELLAGLSPVRPRATCTSRTPCSATSTTPTGSPRPSSSPTAPGRPSGQGISSAATAAAASPASRWASASTGQSSPTRFLVIDVRNDPLGTPNAYLGADPVRPFVSIGLPHGVRRFEFMIFDDETDEQVADPRLRAPAARPARAGPGRSGLHPAARLHPARPDRRSVPHRVTC